MSRELRGLQETEREQKEVELTAARERQKAVTDLETGVSRKLCVKAHVLCLVLILRFWGIHMKLLTQRCHFSYFFKDFADFTSSQKT